ARADAVVSCADHLPDRRRREVDGWCARHAVAWHRCHAEGTGYVVGPMTVPDHTAGYTDVRGRRLAAAGSPDELAALWQHLDDPQVPLPAVPGPSAAAVALLSGMLAHDVLTWCATGLPAVPDHLLDIDPARATVVHRPLLPLPVTAVADRTGAP
ncbi:hypothetical protein GT354_50365, partial [Streptomyces sp. SID3343]|nr:hypothetical protein [Streptomyces sp. SID3343]